MKNWIVIVLLLFTSSAFAELTPKDIQTITDIIEKSEKRTREYIDTKLEAFEHKFTSRMDSLDHKLTGRIEALEGKVDATDKNITLIMSLLVGLMALIVLAVGIPQLLLIFRQRSQNAMQKELEATQTELQQLREAIAPLLKDRIVKP